MGPSVLGVLLAAQVASAGPAGPHQALIDRGWLQLHDLDYEAALQSFRELERLEPDSPRPYLYQAVELWLETLERRQDLEVSRFINSVHFGEKTREQDPATDARFDALLDQALARAPGRGTEAAATTDQLYLLASIHGLRASYRVTINHDTGAALKAAREAYRLSKAIVARDPSYHDAYLTLGLYDYVTGSLPFYVKWLAYLAGYRGDKAGGIAKIELAVARGSRAVRDAKSVLSVIYAREGRLEEALRLLDEMIPATPRNHVLRFNRGYALYRLGRYREAAQSYADGLAMARPTARFRRDEAAAMQARAWLQAGEAERALSQAGLLLARPTVPPEVQVRARLIIARSLDALGRRQEALPHYRALVNERNVGGSRAAGRRGLKTPFVLPPEASTARAGP